MFSNIFDFGWNQVPEFCQSPQRNFFEPGLAKDEAIVCPMYDAVVVINRTQLLKPDLPK